MLDFVHLHTHSDFSLLDGAASIEGLVGQAVAHGMKALALTDHGNMFGTPKFYLECRKSEVKPGIAYWTGGQLIAVAQADEGAGPDRHLEPLGADPAGGESAWGFERCDRFLCLDRAWAGVRPRPVGVDRRRSVFPSGGRINFRGGGSGRGRAEAPRGPARRGGPARTGSAHVGQFQGAPVPFPDHPAEQLIVGMLVQQAGTYPLMLNGPY